MGTTFPVEIWEQILKYAISVPQFFETDPASSYGVKFLDRYDCLLDYWSSERTRNSARRVCSTWNALLKRYDHRYVQMEDVRLGRIPITAIPLAGNGRNNGPSEGCYEPSASRWEARTARVAIEILQGSLPMADDVDFALLMNITPRLQVITHCEEKRLSQLRLYPAPIRFISTPGIANLEGTSLSNTNGLHMEHLTSLKLAHLSLDDLSLADETFHWNLPSLRHLIIQHATSSSGYRGVLKLLEMVGKNLLTFYIVNSFPQLVKLTDEIWRMIPAVRRIEIPSWGKADPPPNHPVRYARIAFRFVAHNMDLGMEDHIDWIPGWGVGRGNRRKRQSQQNSVAEFEVQMDQTWGEILRYQRPHMYGGARWLAEGYSAMGTRFTDSEGISLNEYIFFLIKHYWKGGRATRRRP